MMEYMGNPKLYKEFQTNASGKNLLHRAGGVATKQLGTASDSYQAFNKLVNYHLYGIKYGDTGILDSTLYGNVSTKKALLAAKNYMSLTSLGFGFFPGVAAFSQGHISSYIEAKKGLMFDEKQWGRAIKYFGTDTKKARGITDFFNIYSEEYSYRKALELSNSKAVQLFSSRSAFFPVRLGDESVDDVLLVAMAQNYGLDEDGNIRRLANLREGVKSIWDLASVDSEGKFKINLTENSFIQFKNAVHRESMRIKGTMNDQDVAQHNLNLAMSLMGQFKTWIPYVMEERISGLKYDKATDALHYGRFNAFINEMEHQQGAGYVAWMSGVVLPNMGKLAADIGTFGLSSKIFNRVDKKHAENYFNRWKIQPENATKVKAMYKAAYSTWKSKNQSKMPYEEWIVKHNKEANQMLLDGFIDIKQRQIRALTNELRAILLIGAMIAFMAMPGDDDKEPRYYGSWLGRTIFKSFNRAQSELLFSFSPSQFIKMIQNPLPLTSLLVKAQQAGTNTFDEMRDAIFGENSPQDKTPMLYYSTQFVPGMVQLGRFLEFFEQQKKNVF
jgi:hypothetical protein